MPEPLVYVSGYLKQHQAEYDRRLSAVRNEGDWEGWVGFFLHGAEAAATEAERGIVAIASLINADRAEEEPLVQLCGLCRIAGERPMTSLMRASAPWPRGSSDFTSNVRHPGWHRDIDGYGKMRMQLTCNETV